MNPIVYAIPVFMLAIALEAWLSHRRADRALGSRPSEAGYEIADAVTSLHFGVVSQVAIAFTWLFTFGFYLHTFEHLRRSLR